MEEAILEKVDEVQARRLDVVVGKKMKNEQESSGESIDPPGSRHQSS